MKYPQQLDAHIKSYKRERIKKLLQTFREQKELLTLSEEPVKKIRYKISFPETSAIIALLPKKPDILKFAPVEYKKIKKVTPPVFGSQIYSHKNIDVSIKTATANINSKIFPDNVKIPVPYYKKTEIKKVTPPVFGSQIYSNKNIDVSIKTATANINSKIFPDNVKIPVPYYKKTEIKKVTPPVFGSQIYSNKVPDVSIKTATANINLYKNKPVQFKTPNQNITLPVLKTSAIDFEKINFKNNFHTVELKPMPEISKTTYQDIKIDTNFCNGIKLNDIPKASLPTLRTDINIPPVKKKNFRLPDLDFSDTLEKLKNAIIKDMGKYNEE